MFHLHEILPWRVAKELFADLAGVYFPAALRSSINNPAEFIVSSGSGYRAMIISGVTR